ncbi:hypothetical protein LPB03_07120 [Polaribacter vadi]|uniref:Polysaccharide biosynthesis protein C-terminal domain-containing protein n=1 Tax=Polaribacter vadi TaxID=1774273 RepID=A0A1B8TZ26_9FLAO|nr:oligosaccharide flippase family protein [Polaribacter vadi]AOW17249.1 hypothetical protein LPB03_07120 [Polaribacter vadi]OBY64824.1 hypothetical protein LPB3_05370 [Polaribacter vadi]
MNIHNLYKNFMQNGRTNQVVRLFAVNIITIPVGILVSIFLTRFLGAEDYGNYQFINSVFAFTITIFTFGFIQATSRSLVLNHNPLRAKQYYGAALIILFGIFILMSLVLFLYGTFDENLKLKKLDSIFLLSIPIGFIFLLKLYFETLLQSDNQIKLLAQSRLIPKVLFGIAVAVLFIFYNNTLLSKLKLTLLFFFITQILVYSYIILKLNISFKSFNKRFKDIKKYNNVFGFNVYLGSLLALGFASLSQILIGYFSSDNSGVGYFSLAITFSLPLSLIPNTIATTHYKDFSSLKAIPTKLILITMGLSVLALIGVWVLVPPFVNYFYGEEYAEVIPLNFIVSIGVVLYGFGDFFNRFLGANGKGKALRNSAFYVGGSLMITSVLFIPKYGVYGAAYAKLIAGLTYLILIYYYYYKFKVAHKK